MSLPEICGLNCNNKIEELRVKTVKSKLSSRKKVFRQDEQKLPHHMCHSMKMHEKT